MADRLDHDVSPSNDASPSRSGRLRLRQIIMQPTMLTPLVLAMGFIGASLRYALEILIPSNGGFPFATLIVNVIGCFLLEIINHFVGRRLHLPAPLVKSLGLGLVGAFTTLSALSTENLGFLLEGNYGLSALSLALTIFTTFAASLAGRSAAQSLAVMRVARMRRRHEEKRRP